MQTGWDCCKKANIDGRGRMGCWLLPFPKYFPLLCKSGGKFSWRWLVVASGGNMLEKNMERYKRETVTTSRGKKICDIGESAACNVYIDHVKGTAQRDFLLLLFPEKINSLLSVTVGSTNSNLRQHHF
jgi:hypothetical protein